MPSETFFDLAVGLVMAELQAEPGFQHWWDSLDESEHARLRARLSQALWVAMEETAAEE
jgi:hypothetical protein